MFRFVLLLSIIFAQCVLAQTYPTKPIRLVVGYPPGGPTDFVARAYAGKMTE